MGGVERFEDLDAWKLATELSAAVHQMTETGKAARDFKFRNQIRDSAASAPRNIAEGWGRYYPNENAPYVRIAKASIDETQNHLLAGKERRYFTIEDFDKAWNLSKRARGATLRYLQYLESCEGNIPGQPPRKPKSKGGRPKKPGTETSQNPKEPEPKEPEPGTGNLEPGTG